MKFQFVSIIIALIILVLMLIFVGYSLYKNRKNKKFPPITGECPDYWVSKNKECINPHNLGRCPDAKNFNTQNYKGHNASCLKSKWAKNCNLTWQGITNDPTICGSV